MPKFFFDVRRGCGALEHDDVGIDLPDFEAAYLAAHRAAIDIWAEARRAGTPLAACCFEVRDADDRIILEMPFREAVGLPIGGL